MMYAYAKENDCAVCISTSGNSANVVNAAIAAKAKSISVISLTGKDGGKLKDFSDVVIKVPETETYKDFRNFTCRFITFCAPHSKVKCSEIKEVCLN